MGVAGTRVYKVKTGTRPEVKFSVHFKPQTEQFFIPVSHEHYVKLNDDERKSLGVDGIHHFSRSHSYVIHGRSFSETASRYEKLLDIVNDTIEGIECKPMIRVRFASHIMNVTELIGDKRIMLMNASKRESFMNKQMIHLDLDFHRVWHIKTNKREGILEQALENSLPEFVRQALDRGFFGDGLDGERRVIYIAWEQATWDALVELHAHMHKLLVDLSALLEKDGLAQRLIAASSNGKMLNA